MGGLAIGGVGKAGVIGATVAAGGVVALKVLKSVTVAAQDAEVAQAGLDQAFKASGVSVAKYGKNVDRTIQKVSKLAGFDDEDVSRSFANLLRTTGSVTKATRDAALAADIARARRISLAAATKIVEKAENGQLRGLKAVGVQIDANTTSTEAIERAQQKFAGSAEAYGKTAAGAQDRYRVALENVEERIGAKLLPLQTKLALKAVEFLDWSDKNWPRFAKAVTDTYTKIKPIVDANIALFKGIANTIVGVVRTVRAVINGDWAAAWKGAKQIAIDGALGILGAVTAIPRKIVKALGKEAFKGIEAGVTAAMNAVIAIVNNAIGKINSVGGLLNKVVPGNPVGKIPKISPVGGSSKQTSSSGPTGVDRRSPGEGALRPSRSLSSAGGNTTISIIVPGTGDPDAVANRVIAAMQKRSRHGVTQPGGRFPGHHLGVT